jgi:hypothetical protein
MSFHAAIPVVLRVVGLILLATVTAAAVAALYRWLVAAAAPEGLTLLLGLGAVAALLNTTALLGLAIGGAEEPFAPMTAVVNVITFFGAAAVTPVGRRAGDYLAKDLLTRRALPAIERDVSELVRVGGRSITVTIPDEIEDIEGYDPVEPATKESLTGETFRFPRGLTVAELQRRVTTRIEDDYGVGHVDIECTAEGEVAYLALGSRAAGIGPTLAPGVGIVAVRADPAFTASTGDLVQVWRSGEPSERIATAEIRGIAGAIVTLALDEADAERLDATAEYRLVTLPADPQPEREFASLLRSADETMAAVTVSEGSSLVGLPVGGLDVTVAAVRGPDGIEALPERTRQLVAGELLYVIGRPDVLRTVERAASGA